MGKKNLPYDYEVEYLESTGINTDDMQFIDTGIYCVGDVIKIQCKAGFTSLPRPWGSFFGLYAGDTTGYTRGYSLCLNRNNGSSDYATTYRGYDYAISKRINVGTYSEIIYEKTLAGASISMDGEIIWYSEKPAVICKDIPIFILCKSDIRYYNSTKINTGEYCPVRFYYCKIYDYNNVLVRDFIPVVKDNVGYMYDKVSGQLFGNAGTGDFILGPDK